MNLTFLTPKGIFILLFVFCILISFSSVEAERTIRLRKTRTRLVPRHISISARSGNGYARKYSYGRPIPSFSTNYGRNRRNFRRRRNGKREYGTRNYASRYTNWAPNSYSGGRNNPRIDSSRNGFHKKRKEPYPFYKEYSLGSNKQKRRVRPHKLSPMQRPQPPKKYNDFEEDYFFPEEAKRGEIKYEFENRFPRPKKKRRNPGEFEKVPKIPYYDEKPYKTKIREPPFSYSTFIQHPSQDEFDEFLDDPDNDQYYQQVIRNKKKRVKKKTNNSRKKNKDEEYYKPFTFEKNEEPETYLNDYEVSVKSIKKSPKLKPNYEYGHDDGYSSNKNVYTKIRPQVGNSLFSTSDSGSYSPEINDYRGSSKIQETQFNPSYSQSWSSVVETTARPVQYQTENGFQPQHIPSQYSFQQNRDYTSLQKTKTVTANTQQSSYYSQPDNSYKNIAYNNNYVSNQVSASSTNSQTPSNSYSYNSYSNSVYSNQPLNSYGNQQTNTYSNQPSSTYSSSQSSPTYSNQQSSSYSSQSSPTYSQPLPSSSSYLNDFTVQKSVPIYDNTETFYNFNNNAFVNSQSSKHFDNSDSQKYSSRLSADDFIKKHQNLYNNGLSGVPVQGDGYGKEQTKKDYDIGYGDFQFDENPSSRK